MPRLITFEDMLERARHNYRRIKRLKLSTENRYLKTPTQEVRDKVLELAGYLRGMEYHIALLEEMRNTNELPLDGVAS